MNTPKPNHYVTYASSVGSGIRITMEISSRHNKAYRRNFLQALKRAIHTEVKFMRKYCIVHEDSQPLNQTRDFLRDWSLKQGIVVNTTKGQLGFLIREKRTSLGLSQETFAKILQIDRTYVSKLEHGTVNPSLALMRKIHEMGDPPRSSPMFIKTSDKKTKSGPKKSRSSFPHAFNSATTSVQGDGPVLH